MEKKCPGSRYRPCNSFLRLDRFSRVRYVCGVGATHFEPKEVAHFFFLAPPGTSKSCSCRASGGGGGHRIHMSSRG
jgi:hypothetical protein